jgi:hypothetical protein
MIPKPVPTVLEIGRFAGMTGGQSPIMMTEDAKFALGF